MRHLRPRTGAMVVYFVTALSGMLSSNAGAPSTPSRRNSTPLLLASKALAGVGSYVTLRCIVGCGAEITLAYQGFNPSTRRLEIVTTANQDPLLSHVPIIGVDIWEHAFYLQYLNVKVDVSYCFIIIFILSLSDGSLVPQCYLACYQFR